MLPLQMPVYRWYEFREVRTTGTHRCHRGRGWLTEGVGDMEARLLARDMDDDGPRDRPDDVGPRCRVAALLRDACRAMLREQLGDEGTRRLGRLRDCDHTRFQHDPVGTTHGLRYGMQYGLMKSACW